MKKCLLLLCLPIMHLTVAFGQCNFNLTDVWSNLNTCGTSASVSGYAGLTYPSSGGGSDPCPGSSVKIELQKHNGSFWTVSNWTNVSTAYGSNPYSFPITTAGLYRIVGFPTPGGSCTGCGFTTFAKTQQTVNFYTAATANFTINSSAPSPTTPYEGYGYNCPDNALILNNTSSGNMNNPQWQLYVQEATSTGTPTGSAQGWTSWVSGWPNSSYDLKTQVASGLLGTSGAVGKYYLVTLKVKNGCNGSESVKQGLIHINSAPSVPGSVLEINNPETGDPCFSTNPALPCSLCTGSPTMNISNSTGFIFYYRKYVERNISGTWTPVYDSGNQATFTGVTGLTGIYVAYNGFGWVVGGNYRVTLTVGNQCGHDAATSYFKVYSCKTDGLTTDVENTDEEQSVLQAFPNPTSDKFIVYSSFKEEQMVTINLYNHLGEKLGDLKRNLQLQPGDNYTELDLSNYPSGAYIIIMSNTEGQIKTAKVIKQ